MSYTATLPVSLAQVLRLLPPLPHITTSAFTHPSRISCCTTSVVAVMAAGVAAALHPVSSRLLQRRIFDVSDVSLELGLHPLDRPSTTVVNWLPQLRRPSTSAPRHLQADTDADQAGNEA